MTRLWRVVPTLLRIAFTEAVAYRSELLVWFLSTNTPLVMLLLWTAIAAHGPVGRFGTQEFTAYFLVTLIVRLITGGWVVWEINMEVRSGRLAMRLLRPLHPFVAYAAETLAAWPLRVVVCLPVMVALMVSVGPAGLSHDARQWVALPLVLAGAWAATFTVMLAIGSLALYWQSSGSLFDVWLGLYFVLSGYLVPLELFPPGLRAVVEWLPFRYLLSLPVETVLGLTDFAATIRGMGMQWGYAAVFLGIALVLWQRGVRRYEAFGG